MNVTALQVGVYRDGDNNLDAIQSPVIDQAFALSEHDKLVAFRVEDFTARKDFAARPGARVESYAIRDGVVEGAVEARPPADPADPKELARFVARTLDDAEKNGATSTWIDLVDHGGGDGGGLESGTFHALMGSDAMAQAIAEGVKLHAQAHPEDAARRIDGVIANQCLMATLGFASALSHAGVKFLAASPETMLAPGVPTGAVEPIVQHAGDPVAMARGIVETTMRQTYRLGGQPYQPAAAFDVLDLAPDKIATMERAVKAFNDAVGTASASTLRTIRDDVATVPGMIRYDDVKTYPWKGDRPAEAAYGAIAADTRLPDAVRADATAAAQATRALVIAHAESHGFVPFRGASYDDAAGPTVHLPVRPDERDPWAPAISETHTAFANTVDAAKLDRLLA